MVIDEGSLQTAPAFAGLDSLPAYIEAARFIVVPIPYEATTEWLSGTRHGPERIIQSSRLLELYDQELDFDVSLAGIATAPTLQPVLSGPVDMIAAVRDEVDSWLARGKTPVLLGGEHTVTLGAVQAMQARYPDLSVLHLDAHADLRDSYLGASHSQATVMRRVHEVCPIVQAGIRSLSQAERHYIDAQGIPTFFWPPRTASWLPELVGALSASVYVTIDADVFDSGFMPCVGTPEPGGPGWHDIWSILKAVTSSRRVVGFDVVEFAPHGHAGDVGAYTLARLVYRLIGCIHISNEIQEATRHG
jgi:agmatinase